MKLTTLILLSLFLWIAGAPLSAGPLDPPPLPLWPDAKRILGSNQTPLTDDAAAFRARISAAEATATTERLDLLESVALVPYRMQSVATAATATPTATNLILSPTQTAVRVWTGETPVSESGFTLYVVRNGGAVLPVKLNRYEARIITAPAGASLAFGTSDGRAITVAPLDIGGSTLTSTFPVTGTALADQAGPPLWTPTAAHVTLPTLCSSFEIAQDTVPRVVFVSEYDGLSWSPPRWLRTSTLGPVRVRATYSKVALATYDGSTVSVSAPTGSRIGGASSLMQLTFPTITGTSRSVSSVAALKTAIAAAVSGDEIVLADGTYALDIPVVNSTFAANHGISSRQGAEGITIRSASGNAAACILTGNGSGTNGSWTLDHTARTAPLAIKNVTFDFTAKPISFSFTAGTILAQNIDWIGGTAADVVAVAADDGGAVTATFLRCKAHDAYDDAWNFNGFAANNSASNVRLVDCQGYRSGNFANSQTLTTHFGLGVKVYGGWFYDAHTYVIENSAVTDPMFLAWVKISKGTRKCQIQKAPWIFGCEIQDMDSSIAVSNTGSCYLIANRITTVNYTSGTTMFRVATGDIGITIGNYIQSNTGRGIFASAGTTTGVFQSNVFNGFQTGFLQGSSTGAGSVTATNNTFFGGFYGMDLTDTNLSAVIYGNACKTSTQSINCTASSMGRITSNYNVLDPTVDTDFVAGANDTTGADAALDARFFPTASGNSDGTAASLLTVGGTDYEGYPLCYKVTSHDRGARARPRVITGADMLPDLW